MSKQLNAPYGLNIKDQPITLPCLSSPLAEIYQKSAFPSNKLWESSS